MNVACAYGHPSTVAAPMYVHRPQSDGIPYITICDAYSSQAADTTHLFDCVYSLCVSMADRGGI